MIWPWQQERKSINMNPAPTAVKKGMTVMHYSVNTVVPPYINSFAYTCEYDVGTKKVLLILEMVSAYCGSDTNFFHSGSATKAAHPLSRSSMLLPVII